MILAVLILSCIVPFDADQDGVSWRRDCDDQDPTITASVWWYPDEDGDQYGDPLRAIEQCEAPPNTLDHAGDCDDQDPEVPSERLLDEDGDGFYSALCEGGDDCDDQDARSYPDAQELCDARQNNCTTRWPGIDGLFEPGLVLYFEELESGTLGESCAVASGFVDQAGTSGCFVRDCNDHGVLSEELCCVCDLSESFQADQLPDEALWEIRVQPHSLEDTQLHALSFCEGTFPVHIQITQTSPGASEVEIYGPNSGGYPACASNTAEGHAVLQGSGLQPVIALNAPAGELSLTLARLMVRGASDCSDEAPRGSAAGLDLRAFSSLSMSNVCVRDNNNPATDSPSAYGGGVHLEQVDEVQVQGLYVVDNCAAVGGGMAIIDAESVTFSDVTLSENRASTVGGGLVILADQEATALASDGLTLSDNTAGQMYGAGLLIQGGIQGESVAILHEANISRNLGSGISLVNTIEESASAVCSRVELDDVYFADNTAGVDVDSVDLRSPWTSVTLGQALHYVDQDTYQTEACE